jgi:hypothetical protein
VRSPPSSRIMLRGLPSGNEASCCSIHHVYSSSVSPFQAKTGTPVAAMLYDLRDYYKASDHMRKLNSRRSSVVLGGEDVLQEKWALKVKSELLTCKQRRIHTHDDQVTSAPRAVSVSIKTAV